MIRMRGRHAGAAGVVALAALLTQTGARAQATTGLWPELSTPVQGAAAAGSTDAALIVGIDRYDALPRIPGAADNARDWEKYFLLRRNVSPERVKLLTDQNGTAESILARARELVEKMDETGTLFVVFIGHGAPAEAGKKGLLLGADVRPSDASFASRSIAYDDLQVLLKKGKQSRTVMVLDACFSGVSNEGKTLLPQVQPVVAVNLIATSAMTVFSAGSAAEYAGALPGSMRPALSYLMLGALRGWADKDGDQAVTVAEAQEYASRVLRSLPNNHEQHPQVITDADDLVLERGATEKPPSLATIRSQLDTWKPPVEEGPALPKLRVAVTCDGDEPKSVDQGLALYIDGSPTALAAQGGKQTAGAEGTSLLAYVSFPVSPGPHSVVVRVPGCLPMKTTVLAKVGADIDLRGALPSDESPRLRGPSGLPDGFRIGLGLWVPTTRFSDGYGLAPEIAEEARPAYQGLDLRLTGIGVTAHAGLVRRWFLALGEVAVAGLSADVLTPPTAGDPAVRASLDDISATWFRAAARVGPRLPLGRVALALALGAGIDHFSVGEGPAGIRVAGGGKTDGFLSAVALVDVHITCSFPVFLGLGFDSPFGGSLTDVAASLKLGLAYQPNSTCKRDGGTTYGLAAREAKETP